MFIDLDVSKKFQFDIMIYYLKRNLAKGKYPVRKMVKLILFLSQLLHSIKTCYWPIELELIGIV